MERLIPGPPAPQANPPSFYQQGQQLTLYLHRGTVNNDFIAPDHASVTVTIQQVADFSQRDPYHLVTFHDRQTQNNQPRVARLYIYDRRANNYWRYQYRTGLHRRLATDPDPWTPAREDGFETAANLGLIFLRVQRFIDKNRREWEPKQPEGEETATATAAGAADYDENSEDEAQEAQRQMGRRAVSQSLRAWQQQLRRLGLQEGHELVRVARFEGLYEYRMWRRHRRELYGYQQLAELQGFCVPRFYASGQIMVRTRAAASGREGGIESFAVRGLLTEHSEGISLWDIGELPVDRWARIAARAVDNVQLMALLCGVSHPARCLISYNEPPTVLRGTQLVFFHSFADCDFQSFEADDEWEFALHNAEEPLLYQLRWGLRESERFQRLASTFAPMGHSRGDIIRWVLPDTRKYIEEMMEEEGFWKIMVALARYATRFPGGLMGLCESYHPTRWERPFIPRLRDIVCHYEPPTDIFGNPIVGNPIVEHSDSE